MTEPSSEPWFSRENLLGVVFVAIAVGLIVSGVYNAQASAKWLGTASQLEPKIRGTNFVLGQGVQIPEVIVEATLQNPSDTGGILLLNVYYRVFVNSTMTPFSYAGSSVIATSEATYGETIPARSSVNITSAVRITTDVVTPLTDFLQSYNGTLRTFVSLSFELESSYLQVLVPTCTELPAQVPVTCPALRPQSTGVGGS